VLTGSAASTPSLPDQLGDYRILHFATHAQSNDQKGEFSFLALRGKTATDKGMVLYVKDIYNLRLRAELVVLSACETGIGELREGEGNISLARAFAYSGAQSIVTTLWSVNDESTKKLMSSFYEFLEKGLPKDQALQQAKLAYLLHNKGSAAHPFFWGGFTVIGKK
jgi:CHAT domain-containing protein